MKTTTAVWLAAAWVLCTVRALPAEGPRLVNERALFGPEERINFTMRLADGGRKVVYFKHERIRPAKESEPGARGILADRLHVLDVASGEKKPLPLPAIPGSAPMELDDLLRLMNVLSPDGRRLLLPAADDADKDGLFDPKREKMGWAVYDVAAGKLSRLKDLPEGHVLPQFDRTGKGLILTVVGMKPLTAVTHTRPLAGGKMTKLALDGLAFPMAVCPAADVLAVVRSVGQPPLKPYMQEEFALFDMATGNLAKLPTEGQYAQTPVKRAVWSPNGRYLYYSDVKLRRPGEPQGTPRRRPITRVWDRIGGKEVALIELAVPIGPGPAPAHVVLAKTLPGQPYLPATPMLHNASTGALSMLMRVEPPARPQDQAPVRVCCVRGRHIIYARRHGPGRWSIHLAEIAATKDKPTKRP